jgi:hypothetical protein
MTGNSAEEVALSLAGFFEAVRERSKRAPSHPEQTRDGIQRFVGQPHRSTTPIADIFRAAIDRLDPVERAELAQLLQKMTVAVEQFEA